MFAAEIGGVEFEDGGEVFLFRIVEARFEPGAEFGGEIRGQAEVDPAAVLFRVDEAGVLELLQMAGDGGAGDAEPFGDLAGAEVLMLEEGEDHAEPVAVGEGLDLKDFLFHV